MTFDTPAVTPGGQAQQSFHALRGERREIKTVPRDVKKEIILPALPSPAIPTCAHAPCAMRDPYPCAHAVVVVHVVHVSALG